VLAACAAQDRCRDAFPDLASDVDALLQRLSEQPVAVGITDPSTGQPVTLTVDREELGSMLFTLLYVPDLYRHVPALLSAAADGDLGPLVRMAHPVATGTMAQIAGGLRWSVVCNEDVPLID